MHLEGQEIEIPQDLNSLLMITILLAQKLWQGIEKALKCRVDGLQVADGVVDL